MIITHNTEHVNQMFSSTHVNKILTAMTVVRNKVCIRGKVFPDSNIARAFLLKQSSENLSEIVKGEVCLEIVSVLDN